jgi:hypothetical protein
MLCFTFSVSSSAGALGVMVSSVLWGHAIMHEKVRYAATLAWQQMDGTLRFSPNWSSRS